MARSNFEYVRQFLQENECAGADNVTMEMLCTICGKVLINAHSARCGCRFCLDCVTQYLNGDRRLCPGNIDDCCREELMDIGENIFVDHPMNLKISRLIVKCPREGCEHRSELRKIQEHERVCERRPVDCPYGNIGCQERRLINNNINGHLVEQNEWHARLLMECVGRLQNEIDAMRRDIATFKKERRQQQNEIDAMRRDIATLTDDRREQQSVAEQQAERIAHFDEEMRAVKDENQSMKQQIISLQSEMLEQVHQKWLQQEGKLNELQQQATNEKEELLRKVDEVTMRVRENWINVENRERGEFVWVIDQWAARRQAVRDTISYETIYSYTFCMHEHGYRMCLSVCPDGCYDENHLHIVWYLMRGPFDEHLTWPFKGSVTLSVIDQQTRLDHFSYTARYDQYPNYGRWERPTHERNEGFSIGKNIDVDELSRNSALCCNDRIMIRCVVTMA